jgi:AraC-like DNA-binding protein
MEYLTRWRMLLAADRLKSSSDGLSAIAQSLGYESESAFGKASAASWDALQGSTPALRRRAPFL